MQTVCYGCLQVCIGLSLKEAFQGFNEGTTISTGLVHISRNVYEHSKPEEIMYRQKRKAEKDVGLSTEKHGKMSDANTTSLITSLCGVMIECEGGCEKKIYRVTMQATCMGNMEE